jgi:hypothetical protein
MSHRDRNVPEGTHDSVWGNDAADPAKYGQHSTANASGETPEQIRQRLNQERVARGEQPL